MCCVVDFGGSVDSPHRWGCNVLFLRFGAGTHIVLCERKLYHKSEKRGLKLILYSSKVGEISAHFWVWKMGFGHFYLTKCGKWSNFWPLFGWFLHVFGQISGHLPTFCPLLKMDLATRKPSIYAGLRAFWPLSHFFSLFKRDKKNIKININGKKKWAFDQSHERGGF